MEELLMPSDVKRARAAQPAAAVDAGDAAPPQGAADQPLVEPPSAKLIVRLFLIPFIIVSIAVGVMFLIGRLAGGSPSFEEALQRLRNPGGGRTADVLVGPGSKQRYMDAKTVADKITRVGASAAERAAISDQLVEVLENHVTDAEGEVRHFLLLALGRAWQTDPAGTAEDDLPQVQQSRQRAMAALLRHGQDGPISSRKAAILAVAYWTGRPEVRQAIASLVATVRDPAQDLDVRLAAATVLGVIATPQDRSVIDALQFAMRDGDPGNLELVWQSALSLAQLEQSDVADTILMLLDRDELSKLQVLDREANPQFPVQRRLNDQEQQRILINTMLGAARLDVPAVQERLRWLRENDPSPRVRAAAQEVLQAPPR